VTAAVAIYVATPAGSWWDAGFQVGIQLSMVAALLWGLRRVPAGDRAPWHLFAVALLCTAIAPLPAELGTDWLPGDGPDVADVLFLAFYPAVATGLALMIRQSQRRTDWAALIDALTVTAGIGLLAWTYAISPALRDSTSGTATLAVTVAYPIADLVLLAMTILLLRSNGRRGRRAPILVATAIGGYLAGDWAWVVLPQVNSAWADLELTTRLINADYLLSLLLLSLAVVWPQVRGDGRGAAAVSHLTRPQLAALALAMLICPALLITQEVSGDDVDGLAVAIGSTAMVLLVLTRFTQLLKQAEWQAQVVRELSRRDELTGLPNRRAWTDELPHALEQARVQGTTIIVGMIDLDHFKAFNDTYGHPAGDHLLQTAAAAWGDELRAGDVLARYGGEEFIVLLPGSDIGEATAVLDRLRAATPLNQTFSAGLASWDGEEPSETLIGRADAALYAAKAAGRDRIHSAEQPLRQQAVS
jgi:diguanylate cyclase (GGDEF)-like protein